MIERFTETMIREAVLELCGEEESGMVWVDGEGVILNNWEWRGTAVRVILAVVGLCRSGVSLATHQSETLPIEARGNYRLRGSMCKNSIQVLSISVQQL